MAESAIVRADGKWLAIVPNVDSKGEKVTGYEEIPVIAWVFVPYGDDKYAVQPLIPEDLGEIYALRMPDGRVMFPDDCIVGANISDTIISKFQQEHDHRNNFRKAKSRWPNQ